MHPYLGYTVYGPYYRDTDDRQHVVLYDGRARITVSYPKYLVELHLGRLLAAHETVHHKDGDVRNNAVENLEVIDRATHAKLHSPAIYVDKLFICPVCDKEFILNGLQQTRLNSERKRGKCKTGPFCSRRCSGKVNH